MAMVCQVWDLKVWDSAESTGEEEDWVRPLASVSVRPVGSPVVTTE